MNYFVRFYIGIIFRNGLIWTHIYRFITRRGQVYLWQWIMWMA